MSTNDAYYKTGDDALLAEIRQFRDYSWQRSQKNRKEGDLDMKALSVVGPWPEAELAARKDTNNPRPHGHTDIISPYNNRVVNQARMNPRGVEVIPKGEGADKKTAERRESRLRGIDYESKAASADLTALQNAVDRGYGYERVDVEYESPRSRNLKIVVKRIPNPNSILDDPDCQEADRSDRKKLIATQWILDTEAKRRWKNLKDPKDFPQAFQDSGAAWLRPGSMLFAEFWKVHETEERVLFFGGAVEGVFESELEKQGLKLVKGEGEGAPDMVLNASGEPVPVEEERPGVSRKVMQYFTNGFQIFERKAWPGSWIPFPCCVGREKYEGDELVIESLTRKLREPQLNFDVAVAGEMEQFSTATKSKIMVSDKAIEGYEESWKMAHRNPQAFLKYHERDEQGNPVTQPKEIAFQAQIDGFEIARNSFIRDTQNAAGMVGVDQKQRQNESGVAQDKIDEASDISSFHFIDSYLAMVEFRGRIENELLTIIEDSSRTVGFRTKDGKYKAEPMTPTKAENGAVMHPYGEAGAHGVTIKTGPNYQSQMEKSREFLKDTASKPEFLQNPMSPMIIEAMDVGPLSDKMKQVAIAVQPPNVAAIYAEEDGQEPMPAAAVQQMEEMKKSVEALSALAEEREAQVVELQDKLTAKENELRSREQIAADNNETKVVVEQIKADSDRLLEKMRQDFDLRMKAFDVRLAQINAAATAERQEQQNV